MSGGYDRGYNEGWARLMAMPVPDEPMSQDEIAAIVGCSRQAIHNMEKTALRKLRGSELRDWTDERTGKMA